MKTFDVVVMGGGVAGEVAAGRLADAGLDVAVVERHLVGGECSFYACMPSKALLRPQEALDEVRRVPGAAEAVTGELDVRAVLDRRDEIVHGLDDESMVPWLDDKGITLIRDHAVLTGERRLRAGGEDIEAERAVIVATGSSAAIPPIEGLAEVREEVWTNREGTTAKEVPASLVVVGGGVVGCELAQAWRTLGAEVTLVEGERRLLPSEEEWACEQVTRSLEAKGVTIATGQKAERVERDGDGVCTTLTDGRRVRGEQLLAALGRKPNTDDIGLDALGLEPGAYLEVDDHYRVRGHEWLYAIGDANGVALFTHMGKYQARVACDHLLGSDHALSHGADGRNAPRVIFTDPQVCAVGHTTASAEKAGIAVRAFSTGTSGNAGGSFYGRNVDGTTQILVDDRDVIVGCTITGAEVADFLHAATIAIVAEIPMRRLWHAVPAFPTRSEIWLKLLEAWETAATGSPSAA